MVGDAPSTVRRSGRSANLIRALPPQSIFYTNRDGRSYFVDLALHEGARDLRVCTSIPELQTALRGRRGVQVAIDHFIDVALTVADRLRIYQELQVRDANMTRSAAGYFATGFKGRRKWMDETPRGATVICATKDEQILFNDYATDLGRYDLKVQVGTMPQPQRLPDPNDDMPEPRPARIANETHAGDFVSDGHSLKELEATW